MVMVTRVECRVQQRCVAVHDDVGWQETRGRDEVLCAAATFVDTARNRGEKAGFEASASPRPTVSPSTRPFVMKQKCIRIACNSKIRLTNKTK